MRCTLARCCCAFDSTNIIAALPLPIYIPLQIFRGAACFLSMAFQLIIGMVQRTRIFVAPGLGIRNEVRSTVIFDFFDDANEWK